MLHQDLHNRHFRTAAGGLVLLTALALASGCGSYRFGAPPPGPPPSAPPVEQCVYDEQVTLVDASGEIALLREVTWEQTYEGTYVGSYARTATTSGFGFYRGGERLTPEEGIEVLEDPALLKAYRDDRDSYAGAKSLQTTSRVLWITLMAAGVGLTLGGISQLDVGDNGDIGSTGLALTGAGLGAMVAAIPFIFLDRASEADATAYDMRSELYLPHPAAGSRIAGAMDAQAEAARQRCSGAQ